MLTGQPINTIEVGGDMIKHTVCHAAHIIAFARATDFGLKGDEHPRACNADKELSAEVREFRGKAAYSVGLCRDLSTVDTRPFCPC